MYDENKYQAIVLAGGSGTRLWPLSRTNMPKQFLRFFGNRSLLQSTVKRIAPLFNQNIIFVVGEDHADLTSLQLKDVGLDLGDSIISEPCPRNTAPAIYLGLLHIMETSGDRIVYVFPSDHYINEGEYFLNVLQKAGEIASKDHIVTFGIKPTYAETGYGYIHAGESVMDSAREVKEFKEKPDTFSAERFLKNGNYFWNSGMFAFRASVMMELYRKYIPGIPEIIEQYLGTNDKELYTRLPGISFDNAIMERTRNAVVLPVEVNWSDLGSWRSLYDIAEKDENGNYFDCEVLVNNTKGCYVRGKNKLIVLNNINDLVVVDTSDVLFISDGKDASEIKSLVEKTGKHKTEQYLTGDTFYRPWGYYVDLESSEGYKIKKVVVYPGERLSLQKHRFRDERWTIIKGKAKVTMNSEEILLNRNDSVYIERNVAHRLENTGEVILEVIEIQFGDKLEEGDITRIEDDYGRVPKKNQLKYRTHK